MTDMAPNPVDPKILRSLFVRMVVIELVCVAVAIGAFAGFVMGLGKLSLVIFAAALVAGFGAQIWFIAGWAKATSKA
jgi:membrane protein DedA with SNARE-associated domain